MPPRKNPIAAAQAHLGGGGDNNGESGDNVNAGGGDKDGEFSRRSYQLDDIQRGALGDAILDDEGQEVAVNVDAFWRAAADRLGFNPATVEQAADFEDSGAFTAFPADHLVPQGTADLPEQHDSAICRMEELATRAELSSGQMVFDVRDFLLDQIKTRPKPWSACSPGEQRDIAAAAEHAANELVRKVVEGLAANGRVAIRALLQSYAEKDGITATLKIKPNGEDEALEAIIGLHRAQGKHVMITVASADDHKQGDRDAEMDVEEPGLNFEAGGDEEERQGDDDE